MSKELKCKYCDESDYIMISSTSTPLADSENYCTQCGTLSESFFLFNEGDKQWKI